MIPNIIHFIFGLEAHFSNIPFNLVHYLAIKSAYEVNLPKKICFYYAYEPTGFWWDKAKIYLDLVKITPLRTIFGNPLLHTAHQADVIRLQLLIETGGIYLDMDTICVKPFTDLLQKEFVMGIQGSEGYMEGLCNAVMMSSKNAIFPRKWLENYSTFRGGRSNPDLYWDEHSVKLPLLMSNDPELKNHIHIEPYNSFHYPLYHSHHVKMFFEENHYFWNAYCHHLWESATFDTYLKHLTVERIMKEDTTYNLIARKFLR